MQPWPAPCNDHVGLDDATVRERGGDHAVVLGEAGDVGVEQELDAVLAQVVVEQGRHVGIENRQDVVAALHHGHLEPALAEVLGHLEADEARAHHGDAPRPLALDEVGDAVGVLDGAQREHALAVLAGQPRHDRARAGEAVGVDGCVLVGQALRGGGGDRDEGHAQSALDMPLAILVGRTDVDHDAAGRVARLRGELVDVGPKEAREQ